MTRAAAVRRIVRAHRGPLVAVAVVTFLATLIGALVVPVVGALATAGLHHDLDRATSTERDLQVRFTVSELGSGDPQGAFEGIDGALRDARSALPPLLRSVTSPGEYFAQTDPLPLAPEPSKVPAFVALTADPGFAGRTHVVEGRQARAADGDDGPVEVVLSRPVARAIGWGVGTVRTADSDAGPTTMRLVGLFAADDPAADAWEQTAPALRPALRGTGDGGTAVVGTAFTAPASFRTVADGRTTTGRAWFPLRTDLVDTADRAALTERVRTALGRLVPLPSTVTGSARLTTGLPDLLDASRARDASVLTLVAALGSGPLAAVLGVQVLTARLAVERSRERWRLLVAVGAIPATVLGAVLAAIVCASSGIVADASGSAAGFVVAAAVSALLPCAAAAVLVPGHRPRPVRRGARLLVGGAVVVLTAVAVAVTVRAGIGTTAPGGDVDPLAAALPVLFAATGTVVAVRLRPAVLGAVAARRRRSPGLPGFLGTATAARSGGTGTVALAVAVAGIAVALFASVVGSTLEDGLVQAAERSVGADVSVESAAIDADQVAALGRVPGVQAVAGVSTTDSVDVTTRGGTATAEVVAADTRRLVAVQRGVAGAVVAPAALRGPADSAVPVVVSESLAREVTRHPEVAGTRLRVVAVVPDATTFTPAARWLLVDERHADEVTSTGSVDRVLARLRPGTDVGRVEDGLRAAVAGVDVRTTSTVTEELTADPRVPGVRAVALVAAGLGALVGAGSLALAEVLVGTARRQRARLLTTLGLDARRGRRLIVAETVPGLVAAAATAVVVAAGIVIVMLPAADLRSFTGSAVRPPVSLDPVVLGGTVAAVAAALVVVLLAAVAAGTPRDRSADRSARGRNGPSSPARRADDGPGHRRPDTDRPRHGRRRAEPPKRRPNRSRP